MPETADARRRRLPREAARRHEAATILQVAECTARYGAAQLFNGLGPVEARETALFVAEQLELTAAALRRLTRLSGPERRARAVQLVGLGWSRHQVAVQLGVSDSAVRGWLRSRPRSRSLSDSTAGDC
ncbi:MAG TPA: helix-turn-helix domain-containing protein [Trebonia sp.]|nr:helix-turn-helix domain-containing protein [Trebonia sp.]